MCWESGRLTRYCRWCRFSREALGIPFVVPMAGGKLVLPEGAPAIRPRSSTCINSERVTVALGVPTVWLALLQHLANTGAQLPSLKRTIVGGAACPQAIMDEFVTDTAWRPSRLGHDGDIAAWHFNSPKPGQDQLPLEAQRALKRSRGEASLASRCAPLTMRPEQPRDGRTFGALQVRGPSLQRLLRIHGTRPTGPGAGSTR